MPGSDLPNDIIFRILIRLPVKTLIRFCGVCKSWRNLITTDQIFINAHLQFQKQAAPGKLLMYSWKSWMICDCRQISPDVETPKRLVSANLEKMFYLGIDMAVVGSCDGLLCFYTECRCDWDSTIYIWNPALRQCSVLPRSICKGQRTIVVGFGYDPVTNDHKVVKICKVEVVPEGLISYKVGIYSLRENHSWKSITFSAIPSAPNPAWCLDRLGVIHGGFLYWIGGRDDEGCFWLNAFHIALATFQVILVPSYVTIDSDFSVRLFRGRLSISGFRRVNPALGIRDFEVWVMEEGYPGGDQCNVNNENKCYYESRWVKQFVLPKSLVRYIVMTTTNVTASGKIFGYVWPADEHEAHLSGALGGRLVLYDPRTRRVENVLHGMAYYYKSPLNMTKSFNYFVVDNYVESLVSIVTTRGKIISTQTISNERQEEEKKNKSPFKILLKGCLRI